MYLKVKGFSGKYFTMGWGEEDSKDGYDGVEEEEMVVLAKNKG